MNEWSIKYNKEITKNKFQIGVVWHIHSWWGRHSGSTKNHNWRLPIHPSSFNDRWIDLVCIYLHISFPKARRRKRRQPNIILQRLKLNEIVFLIITCQNFIRCPCRNFTMNKEKNEVKKGDEFEERIKTSHGNRSL